MFLIYLNVWVNTRFFFLPNSSLRSWTTSDFIATNTSIELSITKNFHQWLNLCGERRSTEPYKSLLRETWKRFVGDSMMLTELGVRLKEQWKLQQQHTCEFLQLNNKICAIRAPQSTEICWVWSSTWRRPSISAWLEQCVCGLNFTLWKISNRPSISPEKLDSPSIIEHSNVYNFF